MIYPEYKMLKAIRKISSGQNSWITVCYKDFTLTSQTIKFYGSSLVTPLMVSLTLFVIKGT